MSAALKYAELMTTAQSAPEDRDLPFNVFAKSCPSRGTLEHVTGRWGALTASVL